MQPELTVMGGKPKFAVIVSEKCHGVVMSGLDLLSPKMQAIVVDIAEKVNLTVPNGNNLHVLKSLAFRVDDYSAMQCGMSWPLSGAVVINLKRIVNQVQAKCEGVFHLNPTAEFVCQVIQTLGHEVGHIDHWHTIGPEAYNALTEEQRENMAKEFGRQLLYDLGVRLDIEPEALINEPYFGTRMQEWFIRNGANTGVQKAQQMLAGHLIYDDEAGIKRNSLRQYLRDKFDAQRVDERWEQPTFPVQLVFGAQKGPDIVITPEPPLPQPTPVEEKELPIMTGQDGTVLKFEDGEAVATSDIDDPELAVMDMVDAGAVAPPPAPSGEVQHASADEAQLPAGVAAAGATMAAAATAPVRAKVEPKIFPRHNHKPEQIAAFLKEVWMRLYAHTFNKCGWTGQVGAQNFIFTNTAAITERVNIADLCLKYGMPDVVMEYNTHDAQGKKLWGNRAEKCTGSIRGEVFTKSQLPGYTLYLNFWGRCAKRVFVPQNTTTTSRSAMEARNGRVIGWVMNGDYDDELAAYNAGGQKGAPPKKFIIEINNNNYTVK
jgi:hypothetical protein